MNARGAPVRVPVEWMIDTGADIAVVRQRIGRQFTLSPLAASASPTTGGGGILVMQGLQIEFFAEDPSGAQVPVTAAGPVGVKSNDAGSDIIGMEDLAAQQVSVQWDAARQTGALTIPAASAATMPFPAPAPGAPRTAGARGSGAAGVVDHGTWLAIDGVRIEKRLWRRE